MRAPVRSHGFDKPSDLEDELYELDDDMSTTPRKPAARAKASEKTSVDASLRKEVDELRHQVDAIRKQVEKLQAERKHQPKPHTSSHSADVANWLPVIRSVAITSIAGRIFSSSPIMALLVAAVPFALGLSAGSK
ncbi:hypothetical protein RRU01S_10_01370 [Agrobacterium rubi TR3 = NBRC 13261]|uniref:Uncharacterized protein n=2 Tax=Agrobacterium rubi TaxID=28099 RepID=A0A081CUF2_9HYPH|nr:hypothetical protein [Agrobacterium rubi]GAK70298.1 hypothetical protein RRU01S_10_01370 [Agrobacterium rubi TR3 = NBRC 13261]